MAKKKGILDRSVDMVTTRDEKEAAGAKVRLVRETAQKRAAEAKAKVAEAKVKAANARAKAAEAKAAAKVKAEAVRLAWERKKEERAEAKAEAKARAAAEARVYVVKSGDSLSKIAKAVLGDASRWPEIFEANKDKIKNPNMIHPGQELRIP